MSPQDWLEARNNSSRILEGSTVSQEHETCFPLPQAADHNFRFQYLCRSSREPRGRPGGGETSFSPLRNSGQRSTVNVPHASKATNARKSASNALDDGYLLKASCRFGLV